MFPMSADNATLIFERWRASLRDRDRSVGAVSGNFDDLFDQLSSAGVSFEDAHKLLPQAIKAHQPAPAVARAIWKNAKNNPKNAEFTEKEFIDNWNKDIADRATNSFFAFFQVPEENDDDGEPKIYGQMSAKEYKLQRRHADSYPILDTEELERRLQAGAYNPAVDLMNDEDDSGNSN